MYYTQEQIDRANQADLVSFLQSQGEQLTRAGNESSSFCTMETPMLEPPELTFTTQGNFGCRPSSGS